VDTPRTEEDVPMRGKRPKKYSLEYRANAARLCLSSGKPVKQVAEELGVEYHTLYGWVREAEGKGKEPAKPPTPLTPEQLSAEVGRLRKENARLKMERDFLKKAAAFFAADSEDSD
jgi:transposase